MINLLQDVLHAEIPLTKHIGLTVVEHTGLSLTLSAPLDKNTNHKCTAFGGSLYSVAVLSGWGLIYLLLKQHDLAGHIVIQESNTKFVKPVTTDITAKCSFSSTHQAEKFLNMYRRKGIARTRLVSEIACDTATAVTFNGSYVVHT